MQPTVYAVSICVHARSAPIFAHKPPPHTPRLMAALYEEDGSYMTNSKRQSEDLMNASIELAEKLLTEHGEFYPFGHAMLKDEQIVSVAAYDGNEFPPSRELIELLEAAFKVGALKKEYIGTALAYDVKVSSEEGKSEDALAINIDNVADYSIIIIIPYYFNDGVLEFGEITAQLGSNEIFV